MHHHPHYLLSYRIYLGALSLPKRAPPPPPPGMGRRVRLPDSLRTSATQCSQPIRGANHSDGSPETPHSLQQYGGHPSFPRLRK